jgi:hypothetical protein
MRLLRAAARNSPAKPIGFGRRLDPNLPYPISPMPGCGLDQMNNWASRDRAQSARDHRDTRAVRRLAPVAQTACQEPKPGNSGYHGFLWIQPTLPARITGPVRSVVTNLFLRPGWRAGVVVLCYMLKSSADRLKAMVDDLASCQISLQPDSNDLIRIFPACRSPRC